MTGMQKWYIEYNINLIKQKRWKEFFDHAPDGIGGILYEIGFDFMSELGYIPRKAFSVSNIKTIHIPYGVTTIDRYQFIRCNDLKSVTISDSVTSIGEGAFFECSSLTSITIPRSVTSIGDAAFQYCTVIANIKYGGTTAEWKKLIGTNSRVFKDTAYTCNCTDGVVKKSR